jgi:AcrR family transcriptional regulator
MTQERSLRDRKKAQARERIADVAAGLFAERGYDAVSIVDVARAADVSDQTVYNYFPAKPDLVLDRVEEFLGLYRRAVVGRPDGTSPADALRPLVVEDIDRYSHEDPRLARGEFPALCRKSGVLRRFALEMREQQVDTISAAILETSPSIPAIVARAHAAALVSVIQSITDAIGAHILDASHPGAAAAAMLRAAHLAFDDLDRTFLRVTTTTSTGTRA